VALKTNTFAIVRAAACVHASIHTNIHASVHDFWNYVTHILFSMGLPELVTQVSSADDKPELRVGCSLTDPR
jgi:hypothetical protein